MVKIITISREFGSGGRELGKRLADVMGYEYYDREIIAAIAENKGMDECYVEKMLESSSEQIDQMPDSGKAGGFISVILFPEPWQLARRGRICCWSRRR